MTNCIIKDVGSNAELVLDGYSAIVNSAGWGRKEFEFTTSMADRLGVVIEDLNSLLTDIQYDYGFTYTENGLTRVPNRQCHE